MQFVKKDYDLQSLSKLYLDFRFQTNFSSISLTLRVHTVFEKTQATSMRWFAEQQQTSTSRRQKCDLLFPIFSAEFNEHSLKF